MTENTPPEDESLRIPEDMVREAQVRRAAKKKSFLRKLMEITSDSSEETVGDAHDSADSGDESLSSTAPVKGTKPAFSLPDTLSNSGSLTAFVVICFVGAVLISSIPDPADSQKSEPRDSVVDSKSKNTKSDQDTFGDVKVSDSKPSKEKAAEPTKPVLPKIIKEPGVIRKGESLVEHLKRRGLETSLIYAYLPTLQKNVNVRLLNIGQPVTLYRDRVSQAVTGLSIRMDFDRESMVKQVGDNSFVYEDIALPFKREKVYASGLIQDSLYESAASLNIPPALLYEMTRIYSYDIDFQRDIRKGARYSLYYEKQTSVDYGDTRMGPIFYSDFTLHDRSLKVAFLEDEGYFHHTGVSVKKALLKTPIDGARVSSRFGMRRHPILGYSKPHRGIDFGARRGTPIQASGDGIIERASRYGAYGNYIRIKHSNGYKTAYAHLNGYARGIKAGKRVKQGDIIGYVGTTGRSTGPHLHYEVLKGSKRINPSRLKMPPRRKLKAADLIKLSDKFRVLETEITALTQQASASKIKASPQSAQQAE